MKKIIGIAILIIALGLLGYVIYKYSGSRTESVYNSSNGAIGKIIPMNISSPVFNNGEAIPTKYTCDSDGVNPPLSISNVPSEAKSLVLIVDDPDALNGTWTHWLMWNVATSTLQIMENSVPAGATQGQGDNGQNNYGAPCPPSGLHHYHFKLYALDTKLSLPSFSDVKTLTQAINGHIISQSELVGTYSKQ